MPALFEGTKKRDWSRYQKIGGVLRLRSAELPYVV